METETTIAETGSSLVLAKDFTPVLVVTDEKQRTAFFEKVKAELSSFVPDMTTDAGRKAFASKAFDCNKAKAEIERTVATLTDEWRTKTNLANAARKNIVEELEALRVEFRRPLTEWEDAEKAKKARAKDFMAEMASAAMIGIDETSDGIVAKSDELTARVINEELFGESVEAANAERVRILALYAVTYDRLVQAEEDRATLARMKAEEEAKAAEAETLRIEQERAAREAEEAARILREAEAAKQAEADRLAQAAENARLQAVREQQEAAARALAEQQAEAKRQLDEAHAEADRKLAEANEVARIALKEKEAADLARQQEAARIAEEKRKAEAAEEAKRVADRARQQDIAHRSEIMRAAKEALMTAADIDEPTAKRIVMAIVAGTIPATAISF